MKLNILTFLFLGSCLNSFAQVGIGTSSPNATLDVSIDSNYKNGDKAGVAFPLMTGNQIEAMSTTNLKAGTLIYSTAVSTATSKDVDDIGYWYWTGDSVKGWEPINSSKSNYVSYFYAPSIILPTSSLEISTNANDDISYNTNTKIYTVKLFSIYQKQFSMQGETASIKSAVKNPLATSLPTHNSTDLDYYITYFDNTVFIPTSVQITNSGVLSYQIVDNPAVTENTFMNIIYKVK